MQWLVPILLEIITIRPCRDWTNLKDRYNLASYKAESAFSFPPPWSKVVAFANPLKPFCIGINPLWSKVGVPANLSRSLRINILMILSSYEMQS